MRVGCEGTILQRFTNIKYNKFMFTFALASTVYRKSTDPA